MFPSIVIVKNLIPIYPSHIMLTFFTISYSSKFSNPFSKIGDSVERGRWRQVWGAPIPLGHRPSQNHTSTLKAPHHRNIFDNEEPLIDYSFFALRKADPEVSIFLCTEILYQISRLPRHPQNIPVGLRTLR